MASFAKSAFGTNKESMNAGDYIIKKKASATYCKCINNLNSLPFNKYNLNLNLFSKLDLSNVSVIEDTSGNICPTFIDYNQVPNFYNRYVIDPSGQLFGNTECGINKFLSYLVYNPDPKDHTCLCKI
jgi:hypothetical protein